MPTQHPPTLIFLHIPKAGGTTLYHILDWNYDRTHTITIYDQIPPFIALPDAQKRQINCLKGQVFYGIHRYLPQDCTYITILRNPIDRLISTYYYMFARKKRLGETLPAPGIDELMAELPLYATFQLRLLVGGDEMARVLHDPLPDDAVTIAKQHLADHFTVAGVLDYYDETLLLMKQALGWSRAYYARQNVRQQDADPQIPAPADLPPDLQARIVEACAPEMELYTFVKQQTEARIAAQGDALQHELAQLRRANARFERLWSLARPLHNTPVWRTLRRVLRTVSKR